MPGTRPGMTGALSSSDARCRQIGTFLLREKCLETNRPPVRRFEFGVTGS
jgi:hypothetical protein